MIEIHPFGNFVPSNTQYLFLGSFVGKPENGYEWFFANKRSQFWSILEQVYETDLKTKTQQQDLFTKLRMAITDIILACKRKNNSNLDMNLTDFVVNKQIRDIIFQNPIKTIYFSSKFAEKLFKKYFKDIVNISLVTLPSPSPRYAAMTKVQKIAKYKELLPVLHLDI